MDHTSVCCCACKQASKLPLLALVGSSPLLLPQPTPRHATPRQGNSTTPNHPPAVTLDATTTSSPCSPANPAREPLPTVPWPSVYSDPSGCTLVWTPDGYDTRPARARLNRREGVGAGRRDSAGERESPVASLHKIASGTWQR